MPTRRFDTSTATPAAAASTRQAAVVEPRTAAGTAALGRLGGGRLSGGRLSQAGAVLLQLQRRHGNRYVQRVVGRARGPARQVHDVLAAPGAPLSAGIRAEMQDRLGHDFADVRVHTDDAADASTRALDALAYTTGNHLVFQRGRFDPGSDKGVFIQDRAWDLAGTAGTDLGTPDADANAGACSVAMWKLAELFGTDVIARTEFAVHRSATDRKGHQLPQARMKLGVRQVLAPGKEAAETPAVITPAERTARRQITLADPKLQQSLNIIQIIDAIAGQLDRHWHNYYLAMDRKGKVTGVVGIDLDMAFAVDHTTVDPTPVDSRGLPVTKSNFVGMPILVDKSFAAKIRATPPREIKQALTGLITDSELAATLQRYRLVRDAVRKIDRKNIVRDWNEQTAKLQQDEKTSYLGKMRTGLIATQFEAPASKRLRKVCTELGIDDVDAIRKLIITDPLLPRIEQDALTPAAGLAVFRSVVLDLHTDRRWLALLADFQTAKGVAAAKVAKIRKQLDPIGAEASALGIEIMRLEGEVKKQGKDHSARLAELPTGIGASASSAMNG